MELRHLRYFATVAEELHFGRAAVRLNMSQPPLSQQISALERELGVRLLERTTQQVRLTETGKAVLAEAYQVLEQVERLKLTARQRKLNGSATFNLGSVSTVLFGVLPRVLLELRKNHPEITLSVQEVTTESGIAAVQNGQLDVALVRAQRANAPLKLLPVSPGHYIAAIPQNHPLAGKRRVALKSLAGEPLFVLSRQMVPRLYDSIIASCVAAGFSPNLARPSPTVPSQLGSVACGLGIALVPNITRHWSIPGVTYRELTSRIALPSLSLVWDPARQSNLFESLVKVVQRTLKDCA